MQKKIPENHVQYCNVYTPKLDYIVGKIVIHTYLKKVRGKDVFKGTVQRKLTGVESDVN
jgi:hypothetical protein